MTNHTNMVRTSRRYRTACRVLILAVLLVLGTIPARSERLPTVGDSIELQYQLKTTEWVSIEKSERFEVVSRVGGRVVIRSFEPGTFVVRAKIESSDGDSRTEDRTVTVASVLAENDSLEPAPLEPPHPLPANHVATISLALAGLVSAGSWVALFMAGRAPREMPSASRLSPVDELRRALNQIESMPAGDGRLIRLGEAVRSYLARVESTMGEEMTSTEIVLALEARMIPAGVTAAIREILDEADYAKFSGFGGRGHLFPSLASRVWLVTHVVPRERDVA